MLDLPVTEPFGQVGGDVAGAVVGQEPRPLRGHGLVQTCCLQRQIEGGGDILGAHRRAQLPGDDVAREVVEHARQVEPAPTDYL